jgi:putative glutamine amidotransferase
MSPRSESRVPVIGISCYRETARWGVWNQSADLLHTEYADAVLEAGGAPVLLPPASSRASVATAVVAALDGLVIAGGADVEPSRYGQQPQPHTVLWRPDRDGWEIALLDAAEAIGLPVLGVCRGMQVMAVRAGGSLHQHTPDLVGHENHSPGGPGFGDVEVSATPGSRVAALLGERLSVRCHHHQSVDDHPGFLATAWAADETLEAMETTGDRFCVAVQWHPEMTERRELFAGLVEAARSRG